MARPLRVTHALNSVLRFGLELTALYGLARLGQSLGSSAISKLAWLCALPSVMVLLWGAFVSPKARVRLPIWLRLALELVLFGAAARGIGAAHGVTWGFGFLVVSTLSSWLNAATAPPVSTGAADAD